MASRFLRADWHRACRLARPQRSVGGSAVCREASIGDPLASASRTNSGGLTFASACQYSTSGKQLLGRACSTLAGRFGNSADALGSLSSSGSSSSSSSSRFGSVNLVTAGLRHDGCWPRGGRGGLCSSQQGHRLEGRRFLSSRRGEVGGQT